MSNNDKNFVIIGIISGIIGAACCTVPLILLAVGLGALGATFGALLEPYSVVTLIMSFVIISAFVLLRQRSMRCAVCDNGDRNHYHFPFRAIIIGFIIMVGTYYFIHDIAVPFVTRTFVSTQHSH